MKDFFVIILFIIFFVLQRKVCATSKPVIKKLIIPGICFILSFVGVIYVNNVISYQTNQLKQVTSSNGSVYTVEQFNETDEFNEYLVKSGSTIIGNISLGKMNPTFSDLLKLFILLNLSTCLFIFFIFTGKLSQRNE